MKLKFLSLGALLSLALAVLLPAQALAAYPPHGQRISRTHDGCTVSFVHGNAYAGAYARMRIDGGICNIGTAVKVTAARNGQLLGAPWCNAFATHHSTCSWLAGNWAQSYISWSNIVGSDLQICGQTNNCKVYGFNGL